MFLAEPSALFLLTAYPLGLAYDPNKTQTLTSLFLYPNFSPSLSTSVERQQTLSLVFIK
jgi:hypothetical protein